MTVIPVPRPTVIVTPTPPTQVARRDVNFDIQITVPPGIGVVQNTHHFGDGDVRELGGATSVTVTKTYGTAARHVHGESVRDGHHGPDTEGTTTVSITPSAW